MFIVSPRFARRAAGVSLIALAAVAFGGAAAQGKESRRARNAAAQAEEIPWSPRHEYDSVIVELPPLRPWKKGAAAVASPKEAQPAPAVNAAPAAEAAAAPAPAPVAETKPASSPNVQPPAQAAAPPAEAAKPAPMPVEAAAAAPAPVEPAKPAPVEAAAAQSADAAPAANKLGEEKPADPASPQAKQAEGGDEQAKTVRQSAAAPANDGAKIAEGNPAEANSAQLKPVEAKPAEPVPAMAQNAGAPAGDAAAAAEKAPERAAQDGDKAAEIAAPDAQPRAEARQEAQPAAPEAAPAPAANAQPAPVAEAAPPSAEAETAGAPAPAEMAAAAGDSLALLLAQSVKGPAEVRLADRATMWLPAGRMFLPAEPAAELLEKLRRPSYATTQGVILPAGDGRPAWVAYVDLIGDGLIKDADAGALDPAKLLDAYRTNLDAANAVRVAKSLPPFAALGWALAPHYDDKRRLSACVGAAIAGSQDPVDRQYHCQSFALGRQGALAVSLLAGEDSIAKLKGEAAALVGTIVYDKGKSYADADPAADAPAPIGLPELASGEASAKRLADSPFAGGVKEASYFDNLIDVIFDNGELLAIALVALILIAHRYAGRDSAPAERVAAAPARKDAAESEKCVKASTSLFASLKEKLGRGRSGQAKAPAGETVAAAPEPEIAASAVTKASGGGLFAKFGLSRGRGKAAKAPGAVPADRETPAGATIGAEEPASVLNRLAKHMRKQAPEAPAAAPALARVARTRPLPGAAPATEASPAVQGREKPAASAALQQEGVRRDASAKTSEAPAADDEFALVEPGDAEATTAAINARRALREARA